MEQNQIKVVLIGDSGVGKSSLLDMFVLSTFHPHLESTVGSSFKTKDIDIGSRTMRLNIWDTAGQERYQSLTKTYCRGASAAVLVYDITKRDTFNNLKKWHQVVLESGNLNILFVVVGNKEDLIDREEVRLEEGKEFAMKIGGIYKKTSAKTNFGIDDVFKSIAYKLGGFERRESSSMSVKLERSVPTGQTTTKKCCG